MRALLTLDQGNFKKNSSYEQSFLRRNMAPRTHTQGKVLSLTTGLLEASVHSAKFWFASLSVKQGASFLAPLAQAWKVGFTAVGQFKTYLFGDQRNE